MLIDLIRIELKLSLLFLIVYGLARFVFPWRTITWSLYGKWMLPLIFRKSSPKQQLFGKNKQSCAFDLNIDS